MRKSRVTYQPPEDGDTYRLLVSSAFGGPWPGLEKDELDEMLAAVRSGADFSGLELVAFSLRPTSFDLILDVPRSFSLTKKEMVSRLEAQDCEASLRNTLPLLRKNDPIAWNRVRERFGSVAHFMKVLKQVVSQHYHRRRGTRGPIWGSRYSSVILEPGHATRVISAWLDHAPVREGLADGPEGWRWTTFGAAAARDADARAAVRSLFLPEEAGASWRAVTAAYRAFIEAQPEVPARHRRKLPPITRPELMLTEAPHFRRTVAIGDRGFVERVFEINRDYFGAKRPDGARHVQGQNDGQLFTLRYKGDLRKA